MKARPLTWREEILLREERLLMGVDRCEESALADVAAVVRVRSAVCGGDAPC
jgi:hypothetical protein